MSPNKEVITAMWFMRSARPLRFLKNLEIEPVFSWDVMKLPTRRSPCRACNAGTREASTPFPSQTLGPVANRNRMWPLAQLRPRRTQPSVIVFSLE